MFNFVGNVKYPKVVLVTDCHSHLVLAAVPGRGPGSDLRQFKAAVKDAAGRARIGTLSADADYNAEWVHEHVRTCGWAPRCGRGPTGASAVRSSPGSSHIT